MATPPVNANAIALASKLPPMLLRFFAKYPPPMRILEGGPTTEGPTTRRARQPPNPFLPRRVGSTSIVRKPVYSRRRQAVLVKMAREHDIEDLLPYTPKKTEERLKRRVKFGLRVKGTGVGQKVKGKIHERQLAAKMEERREAMLKMPALIREWKAVGKKKWTKFPK